jgi:hypothetical protein
MGGGTHDNPANGPRPDGSHRRVGNWRCASVLRLWRSHDSHRPRRGHVLLPADVRRHVLQNARRRVPPRRHPWLPVPRTVGDRDGSDLGVTSCIPSRRRGDRALCPTVAQHEARKWTGARRPTAPKYRKSQDAASADYLVAPPVPRASLARGAEWRVGHSSLPIGPMRAPRITNPMGVDPPP